MYKPTCYSDQSMQFSQRATKKRLREEAQHTLANQYLLFLHLSSLLLSLFFDPRRMRVNMGCIHLLMRRSCERDDIQRTSKNNMKTITIYIIILPCKAPLHECASQARITSPTFWDCTGENHGKSTKLRKDNKYQNHPKPKTLGLQILHTGHDIHIHIQYTCNSSHRQIRGDTAYIHACE